MRNMKTYIRYLLISLPAVCGLFSSCTDDIQPGTSADGTGQVTLSYTISGAVQSRAEAGDNALNENTINRLDLFIFPADGGETIHRVNEPNVEDAQNGTYNTWTFAMDDLSPADIADNDQIYLIANCPNVADITTLSDLQKACVENLTCNAIQTSFLMDGKGTLSQNGNDATIQVDLKRALAKIRLTVNNESDANASYAYQFVNYAPNSAVLEEGETDFLASNNAILQTTSSTAEDGMIPATGAETMQQDGKLVLYSYANDWYKSNASLDPNPDISGGTVVDGDQIYTDAPIDPEKQTYILLKAPFNGKEWYYKVPVNYQLPENNDEIGIVADTYKDLYRLQRNYIYDITVTIDREGGPEKEPVVLTNLTYSVNGWQDEGIVPPAVD